MQKRLRKETTDSWTGYNCDREYYCPVIIIFTQESVRRTGSENENRENDMLNQFSRTQLLLGEEAMEKLKNSRVAVFGIGGVGGYVCEALVRSGVGVFDLIDDDKVCLTNLNRQIIATRKTVGKYLSLIHISEPTRH